MMRPCMVPVQYPATYAQPRKDLLLDCARLSWLAYMDRAAVDTAVATPGPRTGQTPCMKVLARVTDPRLIECKECDAQCYLLNYRPPTDAGLGDKPVLAICARGTTTLTDWACNAQIEQTVFKDCNQKAIGRVHAGFYRQFIGLFSIFDADVKRHLKEGGNLLCTGHSLGCALATLAALNYASGFPNQVWFTGFGGPRTGNADFAKAFDQLVQLRLRIKNSADPVVSCVPPIGYCHVGTEVHLGPPDRYPDVPVLLDVGDHNIKKYNDGLEAPDNTVETKAPATRDWLNRLLAACM